jgi:glycosyltransferase involved in cell wall biosynthesis
VVDSSRKIRVGFIGYNDMSWPGGINYLKNLLFSISKLDSQKIKPIIFFKNNADRSIVNDFKEYSDCIFLSFNTPASLFYKILSRITLRDYFLNYHFRKNQIEIISHLQFSLKSVSGKKIGWIPDFQHLHLPEMFSDYELKLRDLNFRELISGSDCMIVSSKDALKDCISFEPGCKGKTEVLNFVSQIDNSVYREDSSSGEILLEKYKIRGEYFFLPNQFWKHKNHTVVFKATGALKRQGINVTLVCTGNFQALDNKEYFASLNQLVKDLNIEENVLMLGMVDYHEVQFLMRYSVSVINPSYFEGWSSSVEECKSMGKNMIISDIPVHREQNPPDTLYFNPSDETELAEQMKLKLDHYQGGPDYNLELAAIKGLAVRTVAFAKSYESIVLKLVNLS